jgi:predicted transcriptional regulator of viral defense system
MSYFDDNIKGGISRKEMEVIANLEFDQRYFFTRQDIARFFKTKQRISDFIFGLKKKGRIIKINREKYYLIPIKARSGGWSEHPFIVADEICNSKDYVIGGWAAAKYWRLTEQIPAQMDIYTTKRQGTYRIMNTRFVFHRTTVRKISNGILKEIENHPFRIISKKETEQWHNLRK